MRLKFCLLDADYIEEAGKPLVRLWGVDESGKSACVLTESEPYFYVLPKSAKKAEEQLAKSQDRVAERYKKEQGKSGMPAASAKEAKPVAKK